MATGDLEEAVLEVLGSAQVPLYAREIVDECKRKGAKADRKAVNQLLYGQLAGLVEVDDTYRWTLDDKSSASSIDPKPARSDLSSVGSTSKRESPVCPKCGSDMQKRKAKRGANAGGYFWGCSDFPTCRGIVAITSPVNPTASTTQAPGSSTAQSRPGTSTRPSLGTGMVRPVPWEDGSLSRSGWICRYATAGGSLRSVPGSESTLASLSNCWIARPDEGSLLPAPEVERFVGVARKLLERGKAPPLDPRSEIRLLELVGLDERLGDAEAGRLNRPLNGSAVVLADAIEAMWGGSRPELDEDSLQVDSDEESIFLTEWAPENLPPEIVRSIVVQAPLESLAIGMADADLGGISKGQRRVDFLIQPFDGSPFVVEIDGRQHSDSTEVDSDRDELLERSGLEVIRIPTAEIRQGAGPNLDEVKSRSGAENDEPRRFSREETLLAQAPSAVHRTVLALLEASMYGLIDGDEWVIEVDDPLGVAVELIAPYLDVLASLDEMWQANTMPSRIEWISGTGRASYRRMGVEYQPTESIGGEPDLRILLEGHMSPTEDLGRPDHAVPEIIVRSARLPVRVQDPIFDVASRASSTSESEALAASLSVLLKSIFALEDFREGQLDALMEVIQGRSCAVLLPTGAGKSLIYQMAGLLLPGRAIVVDPIIALMEDQVRGLAANGIDRTVAISSFTAKDGGGDNLNQLVASGDAFFTFVSPERLQNKKFRQTLRELAMSSAVNVAVVDEAHCVSEWGHDFRTSYLNLGRLLKQLTRTSTDPDGPPVLALTGTASRAVLRDVLIELEIERDGERTVIQPRSFDRKELRYSIYVEKPATAAATLVGAVRSLPGKFGVPASMFFSDRGSDTASGIVFCPHKNGSFGIVDIAEDLGAALQKDLPTYAGSAPKSNKSDDWDLQKRLNAERFMDNSSPILVSTKAFGMGIDKPNVRYVVHLGVPGSIESYYQEVGRAGRDRARSECILVLTEFNEARNRKLLQEDRNLEQVRAEIASIGFSARDDVTNQLFFLLNSFAGEDVEREAIAEILEEFGSSLGLAASVEIPMGDQKSKSLREKALHRLVILGVLSDYTVDWGGRKFEAELSGGDPRSVGEALIEFIRRSQPGRVETIKTQVGRLDGMDLASAIKRCSEVLVSFVYETIERSRRRSLREMWLAAREGQNDPNGDFRDRILEYLTQGAIAPKLEKLVDQTHVDLAAWRSLLEDVLNDARQGNSEPAAELRGGSARLLTSSPDHPGLLIARGVSEMLLPDGEADEVRSSVESAAANASRYDIDKRDMDSFVDWLASHSGDAKIAGSGAAIAIGADRSPVHIGFLPENISDSVDLSILDFAHRMDEVLDQMNLSGLDAPVEQQGAR